MHNTPFSPPNSSTWVSWAVLSAFLTATLGAGCQSIRSYSSLFRGDQQSQIARQVGDSVPDESPEASLATVALADAEAVEIQATEATPPADSEVVTTFGTTDILAEDILAENVAIADAPAPASDGPVNLNAIYNPKAATGSDIQTAPTAQVPAAHVTLNQAIFASLNGHPVIGAELERIQMAQADYLTTTLFPNPGLFTDLQLVPLTRPFTVTRQGGPPQQDAILTYPIDWFLFGKRTAAMSSANLGVKVTQTEFQNMVRLRVVQTAQTFYTALEAQALLVVAAQNVENLVKLQMITEEAVRDGGRPAIEASRIRLLQVAAEQRLRTAQAGSITATAKLRAIMGQQSILVNLSPEGDLGVELVAEVLPVDDAFELARGARPDIQAMQWRISKAEADVALQQTLAKPSIAPSVGYTRQYQQRAIGFPDANSWGVGLNMSVPLYDRNQGNICKAISIQRQNQFALSASLLDLRAELEQAVAELTAAEANAKAVAGEQLSLAQKVLYSIEQSYQKGGRPLTDVIDAQRNYRETYALYVSARAEYWRALYRYYGVIGKQVQTHE